MLNTFLEITYFFLIIYLSLFYIKLFKNVVNQRRLTKTSIGFKDPKLERTIRAHANFCETVPINFFLSLILYFNNQLIFVVPAFIILSIGRTIHAKSISNENENLKKRVIGMKLTIIS
ncbi:MAG: MAPEG family protein, partial [Alphaproteobacteria bacterium]